MEQKNLGQQSIQNRNLFTHFQNSKIVFGKKINKNENNKVKKKMVDGKGDIFKSPRALFKLL